ncbi:hypothetical protein [Streptomyces cinnamoneus]|uniref:Uncharacterized protein n=1 Tax=Streptomyces cinnamoneus TaxID=53446 RepID=A0A918TDG6_STRCJ|nr:hypothetical protein [Streptomyces cinnamoneus]GHC40452.1 hypothetical protein GCM10010507_13320 [Streptomyces cinnamoneus]
MVTARPTSCVLRSRSSRVGPRRMLWWAALLLGLLYTHGLSAESAEGHVSALSAASSFQAPAPDGPGPSGPVQPTSGGATGDAAGDRCGVQGHDGHEPGHTAQTCMSGQPQHGVGLPLSCLSCRGVSAPPHPSVTGTTGAGDAMEHPPTTGGSTVLRI